MRTNRLWIAPIALLFVAGSGLASMGGAGSMGSMGSGMGGMGSSSGGMGNGTGGMMQGGGAGYGMRGAGGMVPSMWRNTLSHSYLDVLAPIGTPEEAVAAVNAFLSAGRSNLQIVELWEYATVYKAEIADTSGNLAFDLLADRLTGAVQPEMGLSMMLNASYGSALQRSPRFGRKLALTPEEATQAAQAFLDGNSNVLVGYALGSPEAYPGFYKFHTTTATDGPGMDLMVNGYNGGIWMNTLLGAPIGQVALP